MHITTEIHGNIYLVDHKFLLENKESEGQGLCRLYSRIFHEVTNYIMERVIQIESIHNMDNIGFGQNNGSIRVIFVQV